ncbi:hypothetical protein GCM10010520_07030 [Rhizobium viscosum]
MGKDGRAFIRQDETISGTLEERLAERDFECTQPPAHGRLRQAEAAGGSTQRSKPRNGEEEFEIAPFQGFSLKQKCMIYMRYL